MSEITENELASNIKRSQKSYSVINWTFAGIIIAVIVLLIAWGVYEFSKIDTKKYDSQYVVEAKSKVEDVKIFKLEYTQNLNRVGRICIVKNIETGEQWMIMGQNRYPILLK